MTLPPSRPGDAPEIPMADRRDRARAAWDQKLKGPLTLNRGTAAPSVPRSGGAPEAWFLGPRAENVALLHELIDAAIDSHANFRRGFHPEDPTHLTAAVQSSPEFQLGVERLRSEFGGLLEKLRLSAPFSSMRYQGHMLWDTAMPGLVGLVAALMYNQNNVAAEASPVTTRLEIEAGNDLCRMLGYPAPEQAGEGALVAWGHITSGGTVANIEALWAARNLKFTAVGFKAAIREVPALAAGRGIEIPLWGGERARLVDLDTWTLLNLDVDVVAGLPAALAAVGIGPELLARSLAGYSSRNVGLINFYRTFMPDVTEAPAFLAGATGHYSWPKAATVLGLGGNALWVQRVDADARLSLDAVAESLEMALRRRVPLLCAVAVMGSTEESAVDPLAGLVALREQYRARGLNFMIHADAAWGGYFRTMLRPGEDEEEGAAERLGGVPTFAMSAYVQAQYEALPMADTITVDPHKGGYIPYPAGALCYRNSALRDAISLRAPVVFHNQAEPTIGVYGIEGSKPGSAAAAVWLAHRVIRPDRSGYGRILGQCMWTARRLFCRLAALEDVRFGITPFNQTPAERAGKPPGVVAAERALLRELVPLSNAALVERLEGDGHARKLFSAVGSDQVILAFALNPKEADGRPNRSLARANALNEAVFGRCSVIEPRDDMAGLDLVLTSSRFDPAVYGQPFVDAFCRRMGLDPEPGVGVDFLISTTMDPWTTDTERGDFQAVLVEVLRREAHASLDEMGIPVPVEQKGAPETL